jgi:proline iminopeptidase
MIRMILLTVIFLMSKIEGSAVGRQYIDISSFKIQEKYIDADGVSFFVRDVGKGDPIIILHGGPGLDQGYLYEELLPLAKSNRLIFFDQRGCGRSVGEINLSTISMENYVEDVERIRVGLGLGKVIVLGHSWGGLLGMEYAIKYSAQVKKLILMNSIPANSEGMMDFFIEVTRRMGNDMEFLKYLTESEAYKKMDPAAEAVYYRTWFRHYFYDQEKLDDLQLEFTEESVKGSRAVYKIFGETFFQTRYNLLGELKLLTMPVVVIHGDSDPIPWATAAEIANAIPGAKLSIMEQCGHFPYIENPEELFRILR